MALPLSVIIITLNEEENIERCIKSVSWANEVVVVDSGSQDKTRQISADLGARVLQHEWLGYGQQKNWAMTQAKNDWVLFLDADEEVSIELRKELENFLETNSAFWGARVPRKTWYLGRWITHGGWYPNYLVRLVHKAHGKWSEPEVHESLLVDGAVHDFVHDVYHYTFRDVGDQVTTNIRFARLGAKVARKRGETGSLRRVLLKPIGKFLETYVWKQGFLDGVPGFVISINAAHSIFMKYVELYFEENTNRR